MSRLSKSGWYKPRPALKIDMRLIWRLAALQAHEEFRPLVDHTFYLDTASQFLYNGFDNVKTDTAARDLGNGHIAGAIETLEQIRQRLGRNTEPMIRNRDQYIFLRILYVDVNGGALRREFGGIIDQVDKDLLQAALIAEDTPHIPLDREIYGNVLLAGDGFDGSHRFFQDGDEVQRKPIQTHHTAFQPPSDQQALDQNLLAVQFTVQDLPVFLQLFCRATRLDQFGHQDGRRERRAELMRGPIDEIGLQLIELFLFRDIPHQHKRFSGINRMQSGFVDCLAVWQTEPLQPMRLRESIGIRLADDLLYKLLR